MPTHSSSGGAGGGRRGTMRPASDATWRPEMKCVFSGPDSYALLFLLVYSQNIIFLILPLAAAHNKDVSFAKCPITGSTRPNKACLDVRPSVTPSGHKKCFFFDSNEIWQVA